MAGQDELDKFVKKFVSLWQAGFEATLHVETTAGNAVVNLQVGLGQAKQVHGGVSQNGASGGGGRGGSPSRQRRRQRREAEREKVKAAEEVEGNVDQEEELAKEEKPSDESESADILQYELKIDAHVDCKNYDLVEAIEVNFDGSLDDMKAEKDDVGRYIQVQKEHDPKDDSNCEGDRKLSVYRVSITNCENSKAVIESWRERHNFDDLAFHRAVRDKINIRIREIKRL